MIKNLLEVQEIWFQSFVRKIPWSRKWLSTAVFLPGKSMDPEAWWAVVHGFTKQSVTTEELISRF